MSSVPHYLRLKPRGDTPEDKLKESVIESQNDTHITFKDTVGANKFSKIFDGVSQLDLYTETMQDLTTELFEEKDSVFFTLGPSNSGKSYSVYGDASNPGLAIYSLNEVFNKIGSNFADYKTLKKYFGESFIVTSNANKECTGEFGLSISVFEIYNDKIRDLTLDQKKTVNQSLDIVTDMKDGKIKPNKVRQIYVTNLEDAKTVLHKCIKRRAVSATNLNQTSSRSHLFVYFNLHKIIGRAIRTTRLTVADLAGSERTKSAKTEGKEFKEGNYTNTSLTELGRCLALMKSKKFDRSILRTSKLTRLLLTDLFGNITLQNRIKILLTLDPFSNLSTILHAIRYIQPVAKLQLSSERNSMDTMDSIQVSQLTEEVKALRSIKEKLENDTELAKQKLLESEMEIRTELTEQYEEKIKELEALHAMTMNDLKESNQQSVDEKLKLLSEDYESRIAQLNKEHDENVEALKKEHEYALEQVTKDLEAKIADLESRSVRVSSVAETEVTKALKENRELKEKLQVVLGKLDKSEKELNNLSKKEKKKENKIEELTEEVKHLKEELKQKRKSDALENPQNKKVRFSDIENDYNNTQKNEESNKENFNQLCVLSPIKLIRTSPNKHFKFEDIPPDVNRSPTRVLKESNSMDFTLPSPKLKMRSPSKKKKINNIHIVEDTCMD